MAGATLTAVWVDMDQDKITTVGDHLKDRQEFVLVTALKAAQEMVNEKPTSDHIRALTMAEKALTAYKKEQALATGRGVQFATVTEVHRYLEAAGWKCAASTVYNHVKVGKLSRGTGDAFHQRTVDRYAETELEPTVGADDEDLDLKIKQVNLRKAAAQAIYWETKTAVDRGALVPKEQMETELAARAAIFRADLQNGFRSMAPEVVTLVEGDAQKTPDLVVFLLNWAATWLNRYAEPGEFTVPAGDGQ